MKREGERTPHWQQSGPTEPGKAALLSGGDSSTTLTQKPQLTTIRYSIHEGTTGPYKAYLNMDALVASFLLLFSICE